MKKLLSIMLVAGMMTSCTLSHTIWVTDNPVGTKTGVAKSSVFAKDLDVSTSKAAKNGGISKVGTVTMTMKLFSVKTVVTGE